MDAAQIMTEARQAYDQGKITRRELHHFATGAYLAAVPDGKADKQPNKRKR